MEKELDTRTCYQCSRTDTEVVELRAVGEIEYCFRGVLCAKHAAEWREGFARRKRKSDSMKTSQMPESTKYGDRFWKVVLTDDCRFFWADRIEIVANGCLVLWGHLRDGSVCVMAVFSSGVWKECFAASVLDSLPIAEDGSV